MPLDVLVKKAYAQQIFNKIKQTLDSKSIFKNIEVMLRAISIYRQLGALETQNLTVDRMLALFKKIEEIKRKFLSIPLNVAVQDRFIELVSNLADDDLQELNTIAVEAVSCECQAIKDKHVEAIRTFEKATTQTFNNHVEKLSWWQWTKLRAKQAWNFANGETIIGIWTGLTDWFADKLKAWIPQRAPQVVKESVKPSVKLAASFLAGTYISVYGATSIATLLILSVAAGQTEKLLKWETIDLEEGRVVKNTDLALGEFTLPALSPSSVTLCKASMATFYASVFFAGEVATPFALILLPAALLIMSRSSIKEQLLPIPDKTNILRLVSLGLALSSADATAVFLTVGSITASIAVTDAASALLARSRLSANDQAYGNFLLSTAVLILGGKTVEVARFNEQARNLMPSADQISFEYGSSGRIVNASFVQALALETTEFNCPPQYHPSAEPWRQFFLNANPDCASSSAVFSLGDERLHPDGETFTVECPPPATGDDRADLLTMFGCEKTGEAGTVLRFFRAPVNYNTTFGNPELGKPELIDKQIRNITIGALA